MRVSVDQTTAAGLARYNRQMRQEVVYQTVDLHSLIATATTTLITVLM